MNTNELIRRTLIERARKDPRFLRVLQSLDRDYELGIRNPLAFDNYKDLAYGITASTTGGGPTTTTTITLATGHGAKFPTANFVVILGNPTFGRLSNAGSAEITYCTSRTGDVLTLAGRAMYGPNAAFSLSVVGGDYVLHDFTNKGITDIQNRLVVPATGSANSGSTAGTTSTTYVMGGYGGSWAFTPTTNSGKVMITVSFDVLNTTVNNTYSSLNYGTGTAPSHGTADTGTTFVNGAYNPEPTANFPMRGVHCALLTGLTKGTAYWFDLKYAVSGGTGQIVSPTAAWVEVGGVWT